MSADVVLLPDLHDPTWVAWQAGQITAIARAHRAGSWRFREREQDLYRSLTAAFNRVLGYGHTWEWDHGLGGVVTIDRYLPRDHPYLGVLPVDRISLTAITEAEQSLLHRALADTEMILRRTR